jgi:serine/threonine protein kinase
MPPEALLSLNYNPYLQDVWALGIILYYLLFFKFPWNGND